MILAQLSIHPIDEGISLTKEPFRLLRGKKPEKIQARQNVLPVGRSHGY